MIRGREPEILDSGARHATYNQKKDRVHKKPVQHRKNLSEGENFFHRKSVRLRIISDFLLRKGESW